MDKQDDAEDDKRLRAVGLDPKPPQPFPNPAAKAFLLKIYVGAILAIVMVGGGAYWISQRETGVKRAHAGAAEKAREGEAATTGETALADALHHERWRDAVEILEGWRRAGRTEPEYLRLQVELALRVGQVSRARAAWATLAESHRDDPAVAALEGLVLVAEGNEVEARQRASELRWSELTSAQADLVGRAWIAVLADRDLAAGKFEAVLALIPADLAVRLPILFDRRQACLLSLGRTEEAAALLRRVAHRLDHTRVLLAGGDIERVAGRQANAESMWREALGGSDHAPDIAVALAVAERAAAMGATVLLVDALERMLQAGSVRGSPRLWEAGLVAAAQSDQLAMAVRIAREVEKLRPEDPAWLNNRVWAETLAGRPKAGSLDALAAVGARHPGVPEFAVTEALAAWREGDLARATAALARAETARARTERPATATELLARILVARDSGDPAAEAQLRERIVRNRLVPGERRLLDPGGQGP